MGNNPENTIEELNEIKKWILDSIENCKIEDMMTVYAPNIELRIHVDLSEDDLIPKIVRDAIRCKYYAEGDDNES